MPGPRALWIWSAAWAIGVAGVSSSALAQPAPEVSKADALFNAGRSLLEAGEYADACPKFAEAEKIAPGLGVTLYLADCYERLGKTASALAEFHKAEQIAQQRGDKREAVAHERAARLEAQVPALAIVVPQAAREPGLLITRDGERVPEEAWGTPTLIDPGDHVILASAPSKETRRIATRLPFRRGTVTVTIAALAQPAPAPVAPPVPAAPEPPPPVTRGTRAVVGLVVGGAGVLGVAAGAVLGLSAMSKLDQSNSGPCDASDHCTPAGLGLRQDAEHLGNAATVAFFLGGAAVAAGAVLYLTAPKSQPTAALHVAPMIGLGSGGLSIGEAF